MQPNNQKHTDNKRQPDEAAADVIRHKLDALYAKEPDAKEEIAEVDSHHGHLSKHQRHMRNLEKSGRSLAEIQTAWHEYYTNLPDKEKHEVWQEFYDEHKKRRNHAAEKRFGTTESTEHEQSPKDYSPPTQHGNMHSSSSSRKQTKPTDVRKELLDRVSSRTGAKKHHVKALAFGLGMGSLVVLILMFSFFNERFLTPFIRPSYAIGSTPIITDPNAAGNVGPEPKIIIPKINLEAPVVYDEPTIEDKAVEKALERGVLHYATTPNPGEQGNAVIFGHSSSNIFNKGKYKFAFMLLKSLEVGDTFIVQKDGKRYVYKVYDKHVTSPSDLSVLAPNDRKATVTLITCDPPGLSTNRLIVVGEQIFPDPNTNAPSSANSNQGKPKELPSNSTSLWQRLIHSL